MARTSTAAPAAPKSNKVSHTVQRGEALSAIAARYGVSQSDLLRWNRIGNANKILAGQKLVVYEPASRWTSYTVRAGDSLGVIAQRNGCSVSELKSWNNLGSSTIHPGQRLKVRKG